MSGPLIEKSLDFATGVVLFYEELTKLKKRYKQLLKNAMKLNTG